MLQGDGGSRKIVLKGKTNQYTLAVEGKRKETTKKQGVQEGVPLCAAETNLPKAYKNTSKRTCNSRRKKNELYEKKAPETEPKGCPPRVENRNPLALQKQTCQKLSKIQVKGLVIQGKINKLYEEKAVETGVEGGVSS